MFLAKSIKYSVFWLKKQQLIAKMLYFYCFWLSIKVKTMKLIGRVREIQKIDKLMSSTQSEFLAIYGRRKVGKKFLIIDYFKNDFDFYVTGLAKGNTKQQLTNLTIFINNYFSGSRVVPANWLEASKVGCKAQPTIGRHSAFREKASALNF